MVYLSEENKDTRIVTETIDISDDGSDILICPQHRRTQGVLFLLALTVMLGSLFCVLLHLIIGSDDSILFTPPTDETTMYRRLWYSGALTLATVLLCVGLYTKRPILMVPWAVELALFCMRSSFLMLKKSFTVFHTDKPLQTWSLIITVVNWLHIVVAIYTIVCIVRYIHKLQLARQGLGLQHSMSSSKQIPVYLSEKT